jgi:hypothetical protein
MAVKAQSVTDPNTGASVAGTNAAVVAGDNKVAGDNNVKETLLTKSESRKLTRILCKCFTSYKHMYPLQRYNRQYVAYINANGEKEVLVNCYYKRSEANLGEAKLPGDGKQSYFRATINLHTLQAQDFGFHESPVPVQQDMSLK